MDIRERRTLLVTCGPGLKESLQAELENLGFEIVSSHPGGITTKGSFIDCMKLNLHLRTAYAVLYLLKEFRCGNGDTLYKQVHSLPWESMIDSSEYFCVLSKVDTWSVNNSMFPSLKVKDAIVDRIQKKTSTRPDSGKERANAVVNLFWKHDKAWMYLNTSGVKISDRNYRKMPHMAPLRESLAAGLIMESGYDGSQDIVFPMCGSGTLAIEAAMIATNKAAGSLRVNFGFQHFIPFDEDAWKTIRNDARKAALKSIDKRIIATDIEPYAIEAAKQNAKTAGVDHLIEFKVCDFAETDIPEGEGIVMMNPEYGLRLGDVAELEIEYKRMGDFFKQKCPGYTGYIFTGNKQLAGKVGLAASGKKVFYNGNIPCRLMKYQLYKGTRGTLEGNKSSR